MTRRVLLTNLVTLSLTAIGCDFVADFEKTPSSSAAAGAIGVNAVAGRNGNAGANGKIGNVSTGGSIGSGGSAVDNRTGADIGGMSSVLGTLVNGNPRADSGGTSGVVVATGTSGTTNVIVPVGTTAGIGTMPNVALGGAPLGAGGSSGAPRVGAAGSVGSTVVGIPGGRNGGAGRGPVAVGGGGANVGGAVASGGSVAAGGTQSGGTVASGGSVATGGTTTAAGGTTARGGSGSGGSNASGGTASGGTPATGGSSAGDTTPPTVVSISPSNGTMGVQSTTLIKVTFSEPMNQATVTSALSVSSIAAANLALVWNSALTEVTVTPNGGLRYATGTSPDTTTALTYTATISAAARDLAGNSVSTPAASTFSTMRRITQSLIPTTVAMFGGYAHAVGGSPQVCSGTTVLELGYTVGASMSQFTRGFIRVGTSSLPAPSVVALIENADFVGTQMAPTGDFYQSSSITLNRLFDQAIDSSVFNAQVVEELGTFSANESATKPARNITTSFNSEFRQGSSFQLYRLDPSQYTSDNTYANFQCGGFSLDVRYLIP